MRTGIYVHEPSTVTIRTTDPEDADAVLSRYNQRAVDSIAAGVHRLAPGIYLVASTGGIEVTTSGGAGTTRGVTTQVVVFDKDTWPDPDAKVVALEPDATPATIKAFFVVAKDASPPAVTSAVIPFEDDDLEGGDDPEDE